ncbi:MAG: TetR/AcrR family transcriptional regulator [bacterium]|nr:TetR/AcrR family transcriptional regulator [bacterium]MCP5039524.1 TetR/AcrR family transcriptional regulator [bacterium]
MPKLVDPAIQREQIRAAAREVFAARGVQGTGLTHVAAAAGMGRSSLYHYYPDKDALLADMVGEMLEQEQQLFRACLGGEGTPLERIERLARACAALFPEWASFGRVFMDLRLQDVSEMGGLFRTIRADLAAVICEGQADGSMASTPDARVQASTLIGAIDGLLLQYFIDEAALPDPGSLANALVVLTKRMVAP